MLKTLKRKIALVAVAGLGFGLVSTVPAFAVAADNTDTGTLTLATVAAGPTDKSLRVFQLDATAKATKYAVYTTGSTVALADLQITSTPVGTNGTDLETIIAPGALTTASAAQTAYLNRPALTVVATGVAQANALNAGTPALVGTPTGITTTTLAASTTGTTYTAVYHLAASTLGDPATGDAYAQFTIYKVAAADTTVARTKISARYGDTLTIDTGSLTLGATGTKVRVVTATKTNGERGLFSVGSTAGYEATSASISSNVYQLTTGDNTINNGIANVVADATVTAGAVVNHSLAFNAADQGQTITADVDVWSDNNGDTLVNSNETVFARYTISFSSAVAATITWTAPDTIAVGETIAGLTALASVSVKSEDGSTLQATIESSAGEDNKLLRVELVSKPAASTATDPFFNASKKLVTATEATAVAGTYTYRAWLDSDQDETFDAGEPFATKVITAASMQSASAATTKSLVAVTTTTGVLADNTGANTAVLNVRPGVNSITVKATIKDGTPTLVGAGVPVVFKVASATLDAAVDATKSISNLGYTTVLTDALGEASLTITTSGAVDTDSFTVGALLIVGDGTTNTIKDVNGEVADTDGLLTVNYAASTASAVKITPDTTDINVVPGTKTDITAQLTDQYSIGIAGRVLYWNNATGKRNPNNAGTPIITDADGKISFSVTDVSTSLTILQDTIVVGTSVGGGTNDSLNINYSATAIPSTVTLVVQGKADGTFGVAAANIPTTGISIDTEEVAQTDNIRLLATVKDANGNGVPFQAVTFKPSAGALLKATEPAAGDDAATTGVSATSVIAYTDNTGVATAFGLVTGTGTITITVEIGGKSGTGTILAKNVENDARSVALAADATATAGGFVKYTATAKDRFGNTVPAATITFTKTGVGRFSNGASSLDVDTATDGTATVEISTAITESGKAEVTATIKDSTQKDDIAGKVRTTTVTGVAAAVKTATASTTYTAGSGTTAETAAIKADVKAVSDTVATLSKAVTTIQSSVTELTTSFTSQIKSLSSAIAKISRAISALSKRIKK
jgi:hypothetical protein